MRISDWSSDVCSSDLPKNPAAAKLDVTIPVASLTVASAGLKDHLFRPGADGAKADFFGAAPAPARFVSTRIILDDDGDEAKVTGNLTLNGVTRPVTLDVDFTGAGPAPMTHRSEEHTSELQSLMRSPYA